jgi:flagellar hook-associated protein 3 FlgL
MLSLANTQSEGIYIFAGQRNDQPPYAAPLSSDPTALAYNSPLNTPVQAPQDSGAINVEIGQLFTMKINTTATDAFHDPTAPTTRSVWNTLNNFISALTTGGAAGAEQVRSNVLKSLEDDIERVSITRTEVGGKINRIEFAKNRFDEATESLTDLLSKTNDTDIAEATVRLNQSQAAYQASLSIAARALPMTLLDFL